MKAKPKVTYDLEFLNKDSGEWFSTPDPEADTKDAIRKMASRWRTTNHLIKGVNVEYRLVEITRKPLEEL